MFEADKDVLVEFKDTMEAFKEPKKRSKTNGGATDYYDIKDCRTLSDITEHWHLAPLEEAILHLVLGSKVYYDIYVKNIDELSIRYNLSFAEGTIVKSLAGIGIARYTGETRHEGTTVSRDAMKVSHYCALIASGQAGESQ